MFTALSDFILSLIINEGKVIIPELGYLELKVFPDRRTALFINTENTAVFPDPEGSIQSLIYDNLTIPLKEGKVVTLPEVGIFHPMKRADGSYRISYTISSSFRKLLNEKKEEEKAGADGESAFVPTVESEKDKVKADDETIVEDEEEVKTNAVVRHTSKVEDTVVPRERKKRYYLPKNNAALIRSISAVAVALIASVLFVLLPGSNIIVLLILGFFIPRLFQFKKRDITILRVLWAYHLIFCIYYYFFIRVDSYGYYLTASEQMTSQDFWESIAIPGTDFIFAICFLLVHAGLYSYFSLILFFSLLGYFGIVLLYKTILTVIPNNPRWGKIQLFPFLFFLPNLHLWSVPVGKDSLLFFLIALFMYSLLHMKKRVLWLIFSVFAAYYIRPHVALILLISMGIAMLFRKDLIPLFRVPIVVVFIGISAILFPMVLDHFSIEDESTEEVSEFMNQAAEGLNYGGSAVDISSYPYPLKVFTFLFRPFFFDINGIPALIISFENLLWLLLIIQAFRRRPLKTFKNAPFVVLFSLCFFVLGVLAFSNVMSNLGNIIRQRNMFTPSLLFCILWSFSYTHKKIA